MGLGNLNITSFKPKASKTAEKLLKVVPTKEHKKEVTIQIRISEDKRQMFKEICASSEFKEMSDAIRAFIDGVIAEGTL